MKNLQRSVEMPYKTSGVCLFVVATCLLPLMALFADEPINPSKKLDAKTNRKVQASSTKTVATNKSYGKLTGRVLFEGDIPDRKVLIEKGASVKDAKICAQQTIYSERLIVDLKTRGVKNVVVYMKRKPKHIHPKADEKLAKQFHVDLKNCQFHPHVAVIRTTQEVLVKSKKPLHNVHTFALFNPHP
jgi:hypothetical protein